MVQKMAQTMNDAQADNLKSVAQIGARVLKTEADALVTLAGSLDDQFERAVNILSGVSGKVILTGMGKSGHIAHKIAATLASTGTPSFFVHPGEASHGDLGMITRADAVIALSFSGNTAELADILDYTRRHKIPLIGMTGRTGSILAEQSDIALVLPECQEACSLGLAPTTSTTMMMALGDALAVSLLELQEFSHDDFHDLHPGGSLGKRLLKVGDLMHTGEGIPLVTKDAKLSDAVLEMSGKGFGCVGILDAQGDLCGVVTDGDLRRHMGRDLFDLPVEDVMSANPKTIEVGALAARALGRLNRKAITSLFVTEKDSKKPIGIIHIHDCLRSGLV